MSDFRTVPKDQFWSFVMTTKRNVHPSVTGRHSDVGSFRSVWKDLRTDEVVGYSNDIEYSVREDLLAA